MSAEPHLRYTEAKYLEMERGSEIKHEFYRGEIFAIPEISARHNRIIVNTYASLHTQLEKSRCVLFAGNVRVYAPESKSYMYPEIKVVSDAPASTADTSPSLVNPALIVEISFPLNVRYEGFDHFTQFRTIDSFQEYILIAQDKVHVEHHVRQANGTWVLRDIKDIDAVLEFNSIPCKLALADIYDRIDFDGEI